MCLKKYLLFFLQIFPKASQHLPGEHDLCEFYTLDSVFENFKMFMTFWGFHWFSMDLQAKVGVGSWSPGLRIPNYTHKLSPRKNTDQKHHPFMEKSRLLNHEIFEIRMIWGISTASPGLRAPRPRILMVKIKGISDLLLILPHWIFSMRSSDLAQRDTKGLYTNRALQHAWNCPDGCHRVKNLGFDAVSLRVLYMKPSAKKTS